MTKAERSKILFSWKTLNAAIMQIEDEGDLLQLLEHELETAKRGQYALRIFSHYNSIRSARERFEILRRTGFDTPNKIAKSPRLCALVKKHEASKAHHSRR